MKTSDKSRYNVLYLDSGSGIGGGQRSLLLLLKSLNQNRFRPFVGCLDNSLFKTACQRGTDAHIVPLALPVAHNKTDKNRRFTLRDIFKDLRQIKVIHQIHRAVKEHAIELIHANSLSVALLGGIVARWNRIPIIMHKRYATSYGILDRICEKLLHRVILVSEATRWNFAPEEKQNLIYNGVDLDAFQASDAEVETLRAQFFPPEPHNGKTQEKQSTITVAAPTSSPTPIVTGIVTRITPEKGIHFLVSAMAELKGKTDVKLLVVGGPYFEKDYDYMESLKQTVVKHGLEDTVMFTGFLADTRVVTSLLDIVLVPSIIPEACPRTIIEAMAVGTPVITTPLGGSKELVTPETGMLVPPENAKAIADAIATLASDPEQLTAMGKAARRRAEELFSSEKNTALTQAVYVELLT